MLGETTQLDFERIKRVGNFTNSEKELIDFIKINKRKPSYLSERRLYNLLLRLRKKLKKAEETKLVLETFFKKVDNLEVSNKLVGGGLG
jgi:hypothetical protein